MTSNKILKAIFLLVVVSAITNVVISRTVDDVLSVLSYAFWVIVLTVPKQIEEDYRDERANGVTINIKANVLMLVGFLIIASFVIYSLAASLIDIFVWLKTLAWTKYPTQFITGALSLAIGFTLFKVRQKFRVVYGLTEVVIGVWVAEYQVLTNVVKGSSLFEPNVYLAILTAGIYLIVRGLDNINQGLNDEPIDQLILTWRRRNNPSSDKIEGNKTDGK
jgi:hypothetical protein